MKFPQIAPFEVLSPLGAVTTLAGAAVLGSFAADADNYRFGWAKPDGSVPLWRDARVPLTILGGLYGRSRMTAGWPGRGFARLAAFGSLASLAVTEGMRAGDTKNLWGLDLTQLPSLSDLPLIGGWFGGGSEGEQASGAGGGAGGGAGNGTSNGAAAGGATMEPIAA